MYTVRTGCARNCSADPSKTSAAAGPLLRLRVPTRDWILVLLRIAVTSTEGRHDGPGHIRWRRTPLAPGRASVGSPAHSQHIGARARAQNTTLVFGSRGQLCSPVGTKDRIRAVAYSRQSGHGSPRRGPPTDLAPWRPRPADSAAREVASRVAPRSRRSGAVLGTDARVRVGGFARRPDPFLKHGALTASVPQGDIGFLICRSAVEAE